MHGSVQIGEAFVGDGEHAAHINTVLGGRTGPVATAWATALATPRAGHTAFVVVARPSVPVLPMTLFVNKATVTGDGHAGLTWGPAQAGVAGGVADAVAAGTIDRARVHDLVLIAAVWVDPQATDPDAVYENNRAAMAAALLAGRDATPEIDTALDAAAAPWNPFYDRFAP